MSRAEKLEYIASIIFGFIAITGVALGVKYESFWTLVVTFGILLIVWIVIRKIMDKWTL